jgi:hypothetical protein
MQGQCFRYVYRQKLHYVPRSQALTVLSSAINFLLRLELPLKKQNGGWKLQTQVLTVAEF